MSHRPNGSRLGSYSYISALAIIVVLFAITAPIASLPSKAAMWGASSAQRASTDRLAVQGNMPPLDGATAWINSRPLKAADLRGKVVLIEFWTYTCINWRRQLPYVRAWADKYGDKGLVVIGVHSPEFAFEKNLDAFSIRSRLIANMRSGEHSTMHTGPPSILWMHRVVYGIINSARAITDNQKQ